MIGCDFCKHVENIELGVPCCICEVIASSCQVRDPFMETAFLVDQPELKKHFILSFCLIKQLHIVFMVNVNGGRLESD